MSINFFNSIVTLADLKQVDLATIPISAINTIMLRIANVIVDRSVVFSIKNNRGCLDYYSLSETIMSLYPKDFRNKIRSKCEDMSGSYDAKVYYYNLNLTDVKAEMIGVPIDECKQILDNKIQPNTLGCTYCYNEGVIIYLGYAIAITIKKVFMASPVVSTYFEHLCKSFNINDDFSLREINLIQHEPEQVEQAMMTVIKSGNKTKYIFKDIKIKATKKWKTADGRKRQRTKTFQCTQNPFNADKTKEELISMLEKERDEWLQEKETD